VTQIIVHNEFSLKIGDFYANFTIIPHSNNTI